LIDDVVGYLGKTIDVCLTGTEVAALDGIVKQTENGVAVILVIFSSVDAALRGDGMGAAGLSLMQNDLTLYPSSPKEAAAEAPARPVPTIITSYFRLLAGLTSLLEKRHLSHFSASGPSGIFESSCIVVSFCCR
jgi:hypothetical protein